jgi:hypothetical protein
MNSTIKYLAITLIGGIAAACAGMNNGGSAADMRQKVADAYGIQKFGQIEQIRYTFNVRAGDKHVSRSWIWQPKTDEVTFTAGSNAQPVTYSRKNISAATPDNLRKIDGWFINDNYWLLFPIHMAWDHQAKVDDMGKKDLPIGTGKADCLVVSYPSEGGYTPGDVYDLFLDDSYRITQWMYHQGGATAPPTRIVAWDDYRRVGPLVLSLNRPGANQNFRVWFTDVAVKTSGSADWINAE